MRNCCPRQLPNGRTSVHTKSEWRKTNLGTEIQQLRKGRYLIPSCSSPGTVARSQQHGKETDLHAGDRGNHRRRDESGNSGLKRAWRRRHVFDFVAANLQRELRMVRLQAVMTQRTGAKSNELKQEQQTSRKLSSPRMRQPLMIFIDCFQPNLQQE